MISAVPTGLISGNRELNPSRKVGKKSETMELIASSLLPQNSIEKPFGWVDYQLTLT
jgi:hypothetical protein